MVTGIETQQQIRFLEFLTNNGVIASGAVGVAFEDANATALKLEILRSRYGDNFNTLVVLNTGSVNVDVIIDGKTITTVNGSNGAFSFDWKDGILFNTLAFKNIDGANDLADNALRVTLGRTGV